MNRALLISIWLFLIPYVKPFVVNNYKIVPNGTQTIYTNGEKHEITRYVLIPNNLDDNVVTFNRDYDDVADREINNGKTTRTKTRHTVSKEVRRRIHKHRVSTKEMPGESMETGDIRYNIKNVPFGVERSEIEELKHILEQNGVSSSYVNKINMKMLEHADNVESTRGINKYDGVLKNLVNDNEKSFSRKHFLRLNSKNHLCRHEMKRLLFKGFHHQARNLIKNGLHKPLIKHLINRMCKLDVRYKQRLVDAFFTTLVESDGDIQTVKKLKTILTILINTKTRDISPATIHIIEDIIKTKNVFLSDDDMSDESFEMDDSDLTESREQMILEELKKKSRPSVYKKRTYTRHKLIPDSVPNDADDVVVTNTNVKHTPYWDSTENNKTETYHSIVHQNSHEEVETHEPNEESEYGVINKRPGFKTTINPFTKYIETNVKFSPEPSTNPQNVIDHSEPDVYIEDIKAYTRYKNLIKNPHHFHPDVIIDDSELNVSVEDHTDQSHYKKRPYTVISEDDRSDHSHHTNHIDSAIIADHSEPDVSIEDRTDHPHHQQRPYTIISEDGKIDHFNHFNQDVSVEDHHHTNQPHHIEPEIIIDHSKPDASDEHKADQPHNKQRPYTIISENIITDHSESNVSIEDHTDHHHHTNQPHHIEPEIIIDHSKPDVSDEHDADQPHHKQRPYTIISENIITDHSEPNVSIESHTDHNHHTNQPHHVEPGIVMDHSKPDVSDEHDADQPHHKQRPYTIISENVITDHSEPNVSIEDHTDQHHHTNQPHQIEPEIIIDHSKPDVIDENDADQPHHKQRPYTIISDNIITDHSEPNVSIEDHTDHHHTNQPHHIEPEIIIDHSKPDVSDEHDADQPHHKQRPYTIISDDRIDHSVTDMSVAERSDAPHPYTVDSTDITSHSSKPDHLGFITERPHIENQLFTIHPEDDAIDNKSDEQVKDSTKHPHSHEQLYTAHKDDVAGHDESSAEHTERSTDHLHSKETPYTDHPENVANDRSEPDVNVEDQTDRHVQEPYSTPKDITVPTLVTEVTITPSEAKSKYEFPVTDITLQPHVLRTTEMPDIDDLVDIKKQLTNDTEVTKNPNLNVPTTAETTHGDVTIHHIPVEHISLNPTDDIHIQEHHTISNTPKITTELPEISTKQEIAVPMLLITNNPTQSPIEASPQTETTSISDLSDKKPDCKPQVKIIVNELPKPVIQNLPLVYNTAPYYPVPLKGPNGFIYQGNYIPLNPFYLAFQPWLYHSVPFSNNIISYDPKISDDWGPTNSLRESSRFPNIDEILNRLISIIDKLINKIYPKSSIKIEKILQNLDIDKIQNVNNEKISDTSVYKTLQDLNILNQIKSIKPLYDQLANTNVDPASILQILMKLVDIIDKILNFNSELVIQEMQKSIVSFIDTEISENNLQCVTDVLGKLKKEIDIIARKSLDHLEII